MELKRDGIHTLIVCPGYVQTNFQKNVRYGRTPAACGQREPFCDHRRRPCALAIRQGVERDARTVVTPRARMAFCHRHALVSLAVESKMAEMNGTA